MRLAGLAFAIAATAAALPAFAGTVITSEVTAPQAAKRRSIVYLEPDRVRLESQGNVLLFRADRNTAYLLKPAEKKFLPITHETMKGLGAAISAMRAQLTRRLQSLPPGQRQKAETILAMTDPAKRPKFVFRKTGGTATYGKWTCQHVEQLLNGRPVERLCVVRLSDLGLVETDAAALRRFQAFLQRRMPHIFGAPSTIDPQALERTVGYLAYPVYTDIPATGVQTTTQSVKKRKLAADLFEIPAGYQEETTSPSPH
jgi:hypothetical protein